MKLLYFHIPKTAGSSMNKFFSNNIKNYRFHIEGVDKLDEQFCNSYKFISGHVSYPRMNAMLNLRDWITFATFREPLSYTISHLKWVRKLADIGEEKRFNSHPKIFQIIALKMKEYDFSNPIHIKDFIDWLDEIDFNYFHNTQLHYMHHTKDQHRLSEKQIKIALENIRKIDFIGIQENLDEFMEIIGYEFDWKLEQNPRININENSYGFDINNPETVEALLPLYEKDLILYEEAKRLFSKQKALYNEKNSDTVKGIVNFVSSTKVIGWARFKNSLEKVKLEVKIGDKIIQSGTANLFRKGLKVNGIHPTGLCAFKLEFEEHANTEEITVFVANSDISLQNNRMHAVDNINKKSINGWCIDKNKTNTPVIIELFINNNKISEVVADRIRGDLIEKKLHPTGCAGFSFSIENNLLNENSKVVLKVKGTNFILNTQKAMKKFQNDFAFAQAKSDTSIKKKKLCIVHIGMHKTGSSSIQDNLNKTQNKKFSYFDLGTPNHSVPLYSLFSKIPEKYHVHRRKGFTVSQVIKYNIEVDKMFRKHLSDNPQYDTFVISGEDISILPKESLKKFKNYLLSFFETIRIVAYIRSPLSYINSAFQEVVKGGASNFSAAINNRYPQYKNKFEKFDTVFGKENVFLYYFDKNHLIKNNVTIDFIKKNNFKVNTKNFTRVNESLSLESISLLYVYNKFAPKPIQSKEGLKAYHMLRNILSKFGSKKLQINKVLLQSIIDKNREDLVWIEDRMNIKISNEKSYLNDDSNIRYEKDLFDVAKSSIDEVSKLSTKELEKITRKNMMPILNRAKSVQDIANLMHVLYLKLLKQESSK